MSLTTSAADERPDLLIVDDDTIFCAVMADAMVHRGFEVRQAHDVDEALAMAERNPPEYALVDLRMPGASGLELVKRLKELDAHTRIVVLTGYASIATAVEAIKLGAIHYLTKPADADDVLSAFQRAAGDERTPVAARPLSVARLEWEHIQRVLSEANGNISEAARRLKMHRRTLQRKLNKQPR